MDSKTVMTGLFGYPVGHSMSPLMHNAAFKQLGLNYAYAAFSIAPDQLQEAVNGIRALGFRGVNVTIPHKVEVMQYLDEVDEEARQIGAVNTIVNENGRLIGFNTDGQGYARSLLEQWETSLSGKKVVILGAGGAARGVAVTLAKLNVDKLIIANRSLEKAESLAGHLTEWATSEAVTLASLEKRGLGDIDLLINTTSVGMSPQVQEMPIPAELLHSGLMVSDLIYNPMETRLLTEAKRMGARIHNGLGMFVHQGALAFEHWTGIKPPVQLMREVVLEQLKS